MHDWVVLRTQRSTPPIKATLTAYMNERAPAELLIIGVGEKPANINPSLFAYFSRKGISVEPMTTVSYARTPCILAIHLHHANDANLHSVCVCVIAATCHRHIQYPQPRGTTGSCCTYLALPHGLGRRLPLHAGSGRVGG